jgi:hypothetical protein
MFHRTDAKLENDQLHTRLIVTVGVIMAVTFSIMVIGLLYGMLFTTELAPLDSKIVDLLSTISVFLTGALSGLVATNGIAKKPIAPITPPTP